jgi:hypothetical protein
LDVLKAEPSPDFFDEGLFFSSLSRYFLQQLALQHCLPLQQAFVCALTGDAAKDAARPAISRRYFIESSC